MVGGRPMQAIGIHHPGPCRSGQWPASRLLQQALGDQGDVLAMSYGRSLLVLIIVIIADTAGWL